MTHTAAIVETEYWRLSVPRTPGRGRVVCVPTVHPEGDQRILRCAQSALNAGFDIHLIWLGGQAGSWRHHPRIRETRLERPRSTWRRICATWVVAARAWAADADAWHIHDYYLLPYAHRWAARTGRRVLYDVHEYYPEYYSRRSAFPVRLRPIAERAVSLTERRLASDFRGVNAVSESLAERFRAIGLPAVACGSTTRRPILTENGHRLVRCLTCNLHYVENMPPRQVRMTEIEEGHFAGTQRVLGAEKQEVTERIYQDHFRGYVDLARRFAPSGRWLDIGCGAGLLVSLAGAASYQAEGIELSADRRAVARRATGAVIHDRPVEDLEFADDAFSVVSLINVFSHLTSPLSTLSELRRILARAASWCWPPGRSPSASGSITSPAGISATTSISSATAPCRPTPSGSGSGSSNATGYRWLRPCTPRSGSRAEADPRCATRSSSRLPATRRPAVASLDSAAPAVGQPGIFHGLHVDR